MNAMINGRMLLEKALTKESKANNPRGSAAPLPTPQKEIELIRSYAARGHSLSFTAQLLGIGHAKLGRFVAGTDIKFVKGSQSIAMKLAHTKSRGCTPPWSEEGFQAIRRGLERARERLCKRHTAFGVTGYIPELVKRFNCPVSIESVRSRVRSGMTVEEALTVPARLPKQGVLPPQFKAWVETCRQRKAAKIADVIARRLTRTMLRYRSPEHAIVVKCNHGTRITVEVQTPGGTVLHRLHFAKSFRESGVLFAFARGKRGHIDFIAFEPDSKALAREVGDAK
jgi:hypothetical protein